MDRRLALLDAWSEALQGLLTALSGAEPLRDRDFDGARARCAAAFDAFRLCEEELGPEARPWPAEVRAAVQGVVRLESIALSLSADVRERLSGEHGRVLRAKDALRAVASGSATGRSCDMRG